MRALARTWLKQGLQPTKRPDVVDKRERIGDWENDSVVSRQSKAALNVLADRKSRVTILKKLQRKTAENTRLAILGSLSKYPVNCRYTITYDNGSENTEHEEVNPAIAGISSRISVTLIIVGRRER